MNKRKSIIFIIVFNILVGTTYVVTQLAAKESHHDGHNHEMGKMDHHVAGPGTQPPEAEGSPGICPVMRKKAGMEYSYEYKGKKYYFCCSACIEKFKNDPEKYISKMKEINFEAYQFGFSPEQIT
ncbi:MAG: YHS domain-containing protein, partial [Candidatus Omnitrophota bacterium]